MTELENLRRMLRTETLEAIKGECRALFASGVAHDEIVREVLLQVSASSVADPSWLTAASFINLSDSLVLCDLQLPENKHELIVVGKRHPEYRRIERPPSETGTLEQIQDRFRTAAEGNDYLLCERCLLGIADLSGIQAVYSTILDCLLQPRFLGVTSGPWWAGVRHLSIGCQISLWRQFEDIDFTEVACHLGAKQCARAMEPPDTRTSQAIDLLEQTFSHMEQRRRRPGRDDLFAEAEFREKIATGDVATAFDSISSAWRAGVSIQRIQLAITMHAIRRLHRAGFGEKANWDNLKRELMSANVISSIEVVDERWAIRAAYHSVWQSIRHGEEGLAARIPETPATPIPDADEQIHYVIDQIGHSSAMGAIQAANNFVAGGHAGDGGDGGREFLRQVVRFINSDGVGGGYFNGQRGIVDAWSAAQGHPDRDEILLAFAGWAADYRNQYLNHQRRYGPIWGANLSADGSLLAVVSAGTRVFDTLTGDELMFFRGTPWRFAFHPNSRLLACGWDGGRLQVIDLISRSVVADIDAFPDDVSGQFGDGKFWGMQFSPDGSILAGCSRGCNEVRLWETSTWALQMELVGHTNSRNESVTFSPDGKTIATGGNDGTVRIWRASDGHQLLVFTDARHPKDGRMTSVDFHPDGERIVSAESEGGVQIWNSKTGDVLVSVDGREYCNYAGFSSDGKTMVSEHLGTLCFWNADTGKLDEKIVAIPVQGQHTLFGGANQSRDRGTIVTAGWDGHIRIWDAVTRKERMSTTLELS